MKIKYRVVRDNYAGYEVQSWRWWFPFWVMCHGFDGYITNTHISLEKAKEFITNKKNNKKVLYKE